MNSQSSTDILLFFQETEVLNAPTEDPKKDRQYV